VNLSIKIKNHLNFTQSFGTKMFFNQTLKSFLSEIKFLLNKMI